MPDLSVKRMRMLEKLRKTTKRASETSEQTVHRREQDRAHKASTRAAETGEQAMHRQKQNKASMRATESSEQTVQRREKDKAHKASVRKPSNISAEQAIVHFHSDIENGPYFVCTCCHRLMYSKSVVPCNYYGKAISPVQPRFATSKDQETRATLS